VNLSTLVFVFCPKIALPVVLCENLHFSKVGNGQTDTSSLHVLLVSRIVYRTPNKNDNVTSLFKVAYIYIYIYIDIYIWNVVYNQFKELCITMFLRLGFID
jgi:hypothetical protein